MKYVFRLSSAAKKKMDAVAPPRRKMRSPFIRESLVQFLSLPIQPLADRPHLRGRSAEYKQVCAILSEDLVGAIKEVYPLVSVSVVIQAALLSALRSHEHKLSGYTLRDTRPADGTEPDTDADENPDSDARKPKSPRRKS